MASNPELESMNLDQLRAFADQHGVEYSHHLGEPRLRAKIQNYLEGKTDPAIEKLRKMPLIDIDKMPMPKPATEEDKIKQRLKDAKKLVRVRVTSMDPNKKDWPGELLSVGSTSLGTIKRYIPYNAPDGWHIEQCLLDVLKEKKCTVFVAAGNQQDKALKKAKMVSAYSIEVLDPLTPEQLHELAQRQAMSGSIDAE